MTGRSVVVVPATLIPRGAPPPPHTHTPTCTYDTTAPSAHISPVSLFLSFVSYPALSFLVNHALERPEVHFGIIGAPVDENGVEIDMPPKPYAGEFDSEGDSDFDPTAYGAPTPRIVHYM
jgi:hypothetical protein